MIPGSANALLLSSAADTGYAIERSIRLNAPDSAYLSRTPASAGNRKTWTWAGWVKRSRLNNGSGEQFVFECFNALNTNQCFNITFFSADQISIGSDIFFLQTTSVYRDLSAWYHIVLAVDTTQATANSRIRLYVNGSEITQFSTRNNPTQNADLAVNQAALHVIGKRETSPYASSPFNGYLADIHFIDGQALDPTSFGEFSATTGVWMPKAYSGGSYGTNGFKLSFSDNSTAAALGTDTSGNGNTWTVNNLNVLSSYTDTFLSRLPSGASWTNPTYAFDGTTANYADGTASNGTVSTIRFNKPLTGVTLLEYFYDGTSTYGYNSTDVGTGPNLTGGSWVTVYSGTAITVNNVRCTSQPGNGVVRLYAIRVNGTILNNWTEADPPGNDSLVDVPTNGAQTDTGVGGEVRGNYATLNPLSGTGTLANGNLDVSASFIRTSTIAASTGKWYFEVLVGSIPENTYFGGYLLPGSFGQGLVTYRVNTGEYDGGGGYSGTGSFSASATTGDLLGLAYNLDAGTFQVFKNGSSIGTISGIPFNGKTIHFGGHTNESATTASVFNFGQRPFAYTAPSGFKALCTANLPAPSVTKPSDLFDVKLYTGNGTTGQSITGLGFSPDFVWIKERSSTGWNLVFDTVRGAPKALPTNDTAAEYNNAETLTSFNSNGFSVDYDGASSQIVTNRSGETYAAWCWDAGSSTVTNTQGSISSQVRANASAGFSVVSYTGNLSSSGTSTVGHGLGVAPSMVITKKRDGSSDWLVQHSGLPSANHLLFLNSTSSAATSSYGTIVAPTSSVFTIAWLTGMGDNGSNYIAYCFAPVAGYSSFGSYTGNGSADGPFVYTGFRPRFVLFKRTDNVSSGDWVIYDTARDPYNVCQNYLLPNSSGAEGAFANVDYLSNGFKLKSTASINTSGGTWIYAAFAEHPFQYARAR
jgi:hypothetical protein